jgi:hypothetical protein
MMHSQLEAFLWHPYSAAYQPCTKDFKLNDFSICTHTPSLYIVSPPRNIHGNIPPHFDIQEIVSKWMTSMALQLRVSNHIVICNQSKDLFLIDYILESASEMVLLSIEYSPNDENLHHMLEYMAMVKSICRCTMGISPKIYLLSISGVDTPSAVSRVI